MYKILTLNHISVIGLRRLPRELYEVASEIGHPDAILLRSFDMHEMEIPASVIAVARAGAGVNNIPVEALSQKGIPVFNAPGANANAVKELVILGLLLAARNIAPALRYVESLSGSDEEIGRAVEQCKKRFVGIELPGRTIGIVGLGAIGVEVANAALGLGMKVIGYDPQMTVRRAWQLSSGVEQAQSLDQLFTRCEAVTVHVPLTEQTRGLVSRERIGLMRPGGLVINFARGGIVDERAVGEALDQGHLRCYVTDFPTAGLIGNEKVVCLPHLGASTGEAEDNCAIMVAENLREYLEHGNVRHSVNFPESIMPPADAWRLTVCNANVPNMVGQISTALADARLNIEDLLNKSRGDLAYTVVDLDGEISEETLAKIQSIEGVLAVRSLGRLAA